MNSQTRHIFVKGPVGRIEVAVDAPSFGAVGLALIAHPHPLFGGTMDNKVVQTLARAFLQRNYITARPNFRGVGQSDGVHDEGRGEVEDLLVVLDAIDGDHAARPIALAGFSFGAFVQTRVAKRLNERGTAATLLVLVGLSVTREAPEAVAEGTTVIHGEVDDTVPLSAVLDWARPQDLPVIVIPGADHFFHHRLGIIKRLVVGALAGVPGGPAVTRDETD